ATEALADVAPLTAVQRALWVAAAGDESPAPPSWVRWFRPALTGLLAAAIAGAVGVWWMFRPVDRHPGRRAIVDVTPSPAKEATPQDVARLRGRVVALARELEQLRERADLLDARNDV